MVVAKGVVRLSSQLLARQWSVEKALNKTKTFSLLKGKRGCRKDGERPSER